MLLTLIFYLLAILVAGNRHQATNSGLVHFGNCQIRFAFLKQLVEFGNRSNIELIS